MNKQAGAYVFLVAASVITLVAFLITISFVFKSTAYLTNWGLLDPSKEGTNPAGLNFGRGISLLFTVGSLGTIILCWKAVLTQEPSPDFLKFSRSCPGGTPTWPE